jgi:dihydrolipoamide dehydrogenase
MKTDVVIIGSGTAGLSALREVRRETEDLLLINDGHWGTTCAAVGCMPSKALIEAANAWHHRHRFAAFGVSGAEHLAVDVPHVLARVRRLRDRFVKGPEGVRAELGDRAIAGRARLAGPGRVVIERGERAGETIEARAVILAPGSRPVVPGAWRGFGDRILTSDTVFELRDLPRRIAVIGMGAIGVEMAQALARLGVKVACFGATDRLAGIGDAKVNTVLREALARECALHLGTRAELSEAPQGRAIRVTAGTVTFDAEAVLAAMGRRPQVEGLGLETLGVPLDKRGLPALDPRTLQVGDLPVWLAGDGNGDRPVLHEATDEGHIAGRNAVAAGRLVHVRRTELAIVFSEPGVARVGCGLARLDPARIAIGEVDFSRQGRAILGERAEGLLRLYAERDSGRLVGAEMCAPAAEHLAHLLALGMDRELTVHQMLAMPFYHPVLEEGVRTALRDAARQVGGGSGSDLTPDKSLTLARCPPLGIEALE